MREDEISIRDCIIPNEFTKIVDLDLDVNVQFSIMTEYGLSDVYNKSDVEEIEELDDNKNIITIVSVINTPLPINIRKLRLYQERVAG